MNNLVKRRTCMEKTSKAYEKKVSPTKKKLDSSSNSVYQLTPPFNKIKPSDNSKESTKKLRDYVSYFKPNQQKNHLLNSNFELLQTDYENLKGALKRRQLLTKSNSNKRRESIKKFESNKIQDETANLSHTIENLKQNSINQKKNQSLKKILLISHTVPKNKQNDNLDNINKMKTLKKREENKEDQEKSTTLKKFKFQSSAEDELIDLLNKSFNTTSHKKTPTLYNEKLTPSLFLDSDFSSTKKINQDKKFFKNEKPFTASSCERKIERLYDRFMKERNKRFELESKVNSSIKEIDSVKIKLQFLEENYSNCKCAPKIIPSTNKKKKEKETSDDLINCCVTSQKKQNSFESCFSKSNIKISDFKVEQARESSLKQNKKFKSSHFDDSTLVLQEIKKKIMKGFKNINGCLENKKNENQSNLDDLSIRFQQKLSVFQKAKEKFNRKFRKILEEVGESKIEKLQLDDSSVLFSMIRSKICVLQPKNTNKYGIKHPTFSFSEINNLNSFINFSNSFEETK